MMHSNLRLQRAMSSGICGKYLCRRQQDIDHFPRSGQQSAGSVDQEVERLNGPNVIKELRRTEGNGAPHKDRY